MEGSYMIVVAGIGWITREEYGGARQGLRGKHGGIKSLYGLLRDESIFSSHVKHFGRFDSASQMTCCAVALGMHDARMPHGQGTKHDTGLIGTSAAGCLETNIEFFKDYVEGGRILARGNLFIYTLPSSPLAEAAIYFGLCGPLFYMMASEDGVAALLDKAGAMVLRGEATNMIVVENNEKEALCFILTRNDRVCSEKQWALDETLRIARQDLGVKATIRQFEEAASQP
jgi:hypothetical protein